VAVIDLDRDALRRGVVVAAAVVANFAVDQNEQHSGWVALFSLAVLVGLTAGAEVAARLQQKGTPLTHGMLCALIVFVVVNVFGVARRSLAGDDIRWGRIASTAVLAVVAGAVGGMIGAFRHDGRITEPGGAAP
jgi:putative membrane protein (TIGR04086 family)